MRVLFSVWLLFLLLALPVNIFADECLEGDCQNGTGKGFTEDGKIYEGAWLDGLPDGQGRLFISRGKVIEGQWQQGVLLEEKQDKEDYPGK